MIPIKKLNGEIYETKNKLNKYMNYYEIVDFCNKNIIDDKLYMIINNKDIIFTDLFCYKNVSNSENIIFENVNIIFLPYNKNDISNIRKYLNIDKYRYFIRANIYFDEDFNLHNELINLQIKYNNILNIISLYKDDRLFTLFLVNVYGGYYKNINDNFKNDIDIIKCALKNYGNSDVLENIPDEIKSNKEFFINIIKNYPSCLIYASTDLKINKNFILEAININPNIFPYIYENFDNDEEIIKAVYYSYIRNDEKDVMILKYTSENIRDNKNIVILILSSYGIELEYVSKRLKKDIEVIKTAITQNGYAINFIDKKNYTKNILMLSLNNNNYKNYTISKDDKIHNMLENIPKYLLNDKDIILSAVKLHGNNFIYASNNLKKQKLFIINVIINSFIIKLPTSRNYINSNIRELLNIINIILKKKYFKYDYEIYNTIINRIKDSYSIINKNYHNLYIYKTKNILKKIIFKNKNKLRINKKINKINKKDYMILENNSFLEQYEILPYN